MSHEIVTFWDSAETLKEIMKMRLLAVLLSRWAVYDSTDSKLRVIARKINRFVVKMNDLINLNKFNESNSKNFLWIFWINEVGYFVSSTRQ